MLDAYLQHTDASYNPQVEMVGRRWPGAGYHTTVPDGAWVHETRASLQYALGLLQSGTKERVERAVAIIRRVLGLQDTDSLSQTYGIWPWFLEEPLERMSPPDWNWADFCGGRLAVILADHADRLPDRLVADIRASLGHAAWSIFRRNVSLDYTNIAIMGAGVAAAAGELLDEPRLLEYGRRRLQRVVELVAWHDTFPEYNSPTYTIVAVQECDRILHLVRDTATREAAESLRQIAWQLIAEHFHVGTQQWAGPHARTYSDHLRPNLVDYLTAATGARIAVHPLTAESPLGEVSLIPPLPCPEEWRGRFSESSDTPIELRRRFTHLKDGEDRIGTTWMAPDAVLGSINHEDLWNQRRAVLAYWRTPEDPAVVLRLRFLHDGRDFASAFVRTRQVGRRVLAAVNMLTDRGAFHPYFDHPEDDRFMAEDLRLSWELTGVGAAAERLDENRIALAAGGRRAIVHTAAGMFGSAPIEWQITSEAGRACVQAVCHQGVRTAFDFRSFPPVVLVSAIELVGADDRPTAASINVARQGDDTFHARWHDLAVHFPARAHTYPA